MALNRLTQLAITQVNKKKVFALAALWLGLSGCLQTGSPMSDRQEASEIGSSAEDGSKLAQLSLSELRQWEAALAKQGVTVDQIDNAYAAAEASGGSEEDLRKSQKQVHDRFMPLVEKSLAHLPPEVLIKLFRGLGLPESFDGLDGIALIANPFGANASEDAGDKQCRSEWAYWQLTSLFALTEADAPCGYETVNLDRGSSGAVRTTTANVIAGPGWPTTVPSANLSLACIHVTDDTGRAEGRFGSAVIRVPARTRSVRSRPFMSVATSYDVDGATLFGYGRTFGTATLTSEAVENTAGTSVVADRVSYTPDSASVPLNRWTPSFHISSPLTLTSSVLATQWLGFRDARAEKTVRVSIDGYVDNWSRGVGSAEGRLCSVTGGIPVGAGQNSSVQIAWYAFDPAR